MIVIDPKAVKPIMQSDMIKMEELGQPEMLVAVPDHHPIPEFSNVEIWTMTGLQQNR